MDALPILYQARLCQKELPRRFETLGETRAMAAISASSQPNTVKAMKAPVPANLHSIPIENPKLRAVAEQFESAFLAEMLRHSGFGQMPDNFNGGAGEAAFSGTLIQEYANRIAATGTLGIANRIYRTLSERA